MELEYDREKPIYLQIAETIEDDIISGALLEDEQIPSTNQIAQLFHLNPATVGKGVNLLVERGVAYKKRGLGMFVKPGSTKKLQDSRKRTFFDTYIVELLRNANVLGISRDELCEMIKKGDDVND